MLRASGLGTEGSDKSAVVLREDDQVPPDGERLWDLRMPSGVRAAERCLILHQQLSEALYANGGARAVFPVEKEVRS